MYVYALIKPPKEPLTLCKGIAAPVHIVSALRIAALVEPQVPLTEIQTDETQLIHAVIRHDYVIRQLFAQVSLLPLRFGTQFDSIESLQDHLDTYGPAYVDTLTQLEGKAEYTLTLTPETTPLSGPSAPPAVQGGRAYFLSKKQQYQNQETHQQQQAIALQRLLATINVQYPENRPVDSPDGSRRIYLLAPHSTDALQRAFAHWQQEFPLWQMNLGEALPPYHFV